MLIQDHPLRLADFTQEFTLPQFAGLLPSILAAAQATPVKQMALAELHGNLLAPFPNGFMKQAWTDTLVAKVAAPQSAEATIAAQMLTYGYCSHYFTGQGPCHLPLEEDNPHYQSYTLVAVYPHGATPIVLGTLQAVIGDTVPALALFTPAAGQSLPHLTSYGPQRATLPVGELRRFSVNPLLEAAVPSDSHLKSILRDYRSLIYRKLYELSLRLFWSQAVRFVYGIATPEIYRFFTRSGMTMCPLAGVTLVDNAEIHMIQRDFALYWRPHAPREQQPALYQILLPVEQAPSLPVSAEPPALLGVSG
ncbi:MAG: hypothetical protein R3C14_49025 [Caldilineaceae bacterium]